MPRKRSPTLTDGESRLMNVLWRRGRATVGDVTADLRKRHAVAYNTVQTMLRILEEKGYVRHERIGRAFLYRPLVAQTAARRRALGHLMKALFDNSPSLVIQNVLSDERLGTDEIERLKRLVSES